MRKTTTPGTLAAIALCAATAASVPAADPEPAKAAPAVQERVAVHLVQVSILATDKQGRPVADLKPEEISATLGRRTLPVAYLEAVTRPSPAGLAAGAVRVHLDAPGGWADAAAPGPTEPRYIAIFMDAENDAPTLREEAAQQAMTFVKTRLRPGDRASIFSYDGKLNLEVPFTDDREALASGIRAASARSGRPRTDPRTRIRSLLRSMEQCVESAGQFEKTADTQCLKDVANEYSGEMNPRGEDFVEALQDLVRYLGGIEGRKSVLAVTHGLPIDLEPVLRGAARAVFGDAANVEDLQRHVGFAAGPQAQMDKLLDTLVQNRVTLNFIDRVPPPTDDFQASRGEMTTEGAAPARVEYEAAANDMTEMSGYSGGVRVASTDVLAGMSKVMDLLDAAYDLGLSTDEYLDAKQLKKVDLRCTRKGVKLLYSRLAYVPKATDEHVLRGRFLLGKPSAAMVSAAPAVRQPFRLELDPKELGYQISGGEAQASFTVHLAVLSETAGRLADTFHFVTHSYEAEVWKSGEAAPVTFLGWIEAPPGRYVLRAFVRNVDSGRDGSLSGPIRIEPLRAGAPAPTPTGQPQAPEIGPGQDER